MRVRGRGRAILLAVAILATMTALAPSGAAAATVVNGDFEAGNLGGWDVHRATQAGNWFAYKGTGEPIANKRPPGQPIQPPPQGTYAAIADQLNPDTLVLSQDIALEAGRSHWLSLLAYYNSYAPIAVPAPDTLSVDDGVLGGQANQQFRIDVMRPGTPLESIDPADILLTLFRTQPGGPAKLGPTRLTADLSALAGQTVRLRVAVAAHEEVLAAGVDAVTVDSTPPGNSPPPLDSNRFQVVGAGGGGGNVKQVGKKGIAILTVRVPGPGKLTAKGKLIKRTTAKAARAGKVKLRLKLTKSALETLRRKHRLRVKVAVTFDPAGGKPRTTIVPVVFKLAQS